MDAIVQGFPIFLLIFCRITAFFVVAPVFSSRGVPSTFKIGLGFFISFIVFLTYGIGETVVTDAGYVLVILREIMIGLTMGYVCYLFFSVVQTAGSLMDLQVGFAMANVVDPHTGASAPLLGNFKYMLMLVTFLMMNGHHYMLTGLMDSYQWMPLSNEFYSRIMSGGVSDFLTRTVSNTFLLALQVSAPLVVAMFLTDLGLGFLTKSAPQFNVFVIGIPLKIIIGLFLLVLLMPGLAMLFDKLFSIMFQSLEQLFGVVQGPPEGQ
ncbi:flagellar type III secretion system protein FliR [Paenibacillus sp. GSMTC-2017]|uniref:flagellar biosynthetic protein FliR n=1 Tax=Paenibacillus sp. GSMTC-2017 TaxID=2794350 RepID=UPI0018D786D3|nr:flagellar biosynthetic protein FliR [Paenibacillus sp. GSMTC-2017]MBH5316627.1 flagellar type III secretion system protein FliR [Paenibacillus sp. GSMTC-2017]